MPSVIPEASIRCVIAAHMVVTGEPNAKPVEQLAQVIASL